MTIPCQTPQWPTGLLEVGPPEDGSILLQGEVTIGSAQFSLTAMRVDPISLAPDFRSDRSLTIYANYGLSQLLDVISDLVEISDQSIIQLKTGRYIMWMLPRSVR